MQDKTDNRHNRLKEFIDERSWSKAEFARRVGIYPQDVNKYLSGLLNIENLYLKLQEAGCDMQWLKTGEKHDDTEGAAMLAMLRARGITSAVQLERLFLLAENVQRFTQSVSVTLSEFAVVGNLADMGGVVRVPHIKEATEQKVTAPLVRNKTKKTISKTGK